MKERPILMSGPMVCSTLRGTKDNTRRCIKGAGQFPIVRFERWVVDGEPQYRPSGVPLWFSTEADGTTREWGCPYGEPGDRLWVRETFYCNSCDYPDTTDHARDNLLYRADAPHDLGGETVEKEGGGWKPSIHMPRWASRLTLEITDVRVERVQDITEEDAIAEGVKPLVVPIATWGLSDPQMPPLHRLSFPRLWDGINGKRPGCTWQDNPWVWVISFKKMESEEPR